MKKILILLLVFCLCGCQNNVTQEESSSERYLDMISLIKNNEVFLDRSAYFDVEIEVAKIDEGYRYYVIVDNPVIASYDVEVMAIEMGVDYSKQMAATIGIFDETEYSLIPNQSNPDKGFMEGLIASGMSDRDSVTLYILIQWKSKDMSVTYREYLKLQGSYLGE